MLVYYFTVVFVASSIAYEERAWQIKNKAFLDDPFRVQNLKCHNVYRRLHLVKGLKYNEALNRHAQEHANMLARTDILIPSYGAFGESIFVSTGSVDGHTACWHWYQQSNYYNFSNENPDNIDAVGMFTQMVWRATTETGIGVARSLRDRIYVVANYLPPGNVPDRYRSNVFSQIGLGPGPIE